MRTLWYGMTRGAYVEIPTIMKHNIIFEKPLSSFKYFNIFILNTMDMGNSLAIHLYVIRYHYSGRRGVCH